MKDNKLEKTSEKKVKLKKEVETSTTSKKTNQVPVHSFDAFFQILLKENKSIAKHHKAPIRAWLETKGLKQGTLKQFRDALKDY